MNEYYFCLETAIKEKTYSATMAATKKINNKWNSSIEVSTVLYSEQ